MPRRRESVFIPRRTIGFQLGSSSWIVWSQPRSAIEASTKVHGCAGRVVVSTRLASDAMNRIGPRFPFLATRTGLRFQLDGLLIRTLIRTRKKFGVRWVLVGPPRK